MELSYIKNIHKEVDSKNLDNILQPLVFHTHFFPTFPPTLLKKRVWNTNGCILP